MNPVPPAPWPSVVLDSEGVWSVARNDSEDVRAVLAASREAGVPVLVPTAVLAETLYGDARDARANQVLKRLTVVAITEQLARAAAGLKRAAGMSGVAATIDAIVVAVSLAFGGGVVLTSDIHDMRALALHAPARVRAIPV